MHLTVWKTLWQTPYSYTIKMFCFLFCRELEKDIICFLLALFLGGQICISDHDKDHSENDDHLWGQGPKKGCAVHDSWWIPSMCSLRAWHPSHPTWLSLSLWSWSHLSYDHHCYDHDHEDEMTSFEAKSGWSWGYMYDGNMMIWPPSRPENMTAPSIR